MCQDAVAKFFPGKDVKKYEFARTRAAFFEQICLM
jgi:hypothetical protein